MKEVNVILFDLFISLGVAGDDLLLLLQRHHLLHHQHLWLSLRQAESRPGGGGGAECRGQSL